MGIKDGSLRDIMFPTFARTKVILSAIINFAKFREERLEKYQEFTTKTDKLLEQRAQLEEENFAQTRQANELRAQREQQLPVIKALQEETVQLSSKINELNKLHASMREEMRVTKATITELGYVGRVGGTYPWENWITTHRMPFNARSTRTPAYNHTHGHVHTCSQTTRVHMRSRMDARAE